MQRQREIGLVFMVTTQCLNVFDVHFAIEPKDDHDVVELTIVSDISDPIPIKVFELQKFCHLILSGNPTAMDFLYMDRNSTRTDCWWVDEFEVLRKNRHTLMSRYALTKYIGQARAHFAKAEKNSPYPTYALDEVLRLLFEGRRILEGKDPVVEMEGEEREYIIKVKRNEIDRKEALKFAKTLVEELDQKRKVFTPFETDPQTVKEFLINIRRKVLLLESKST